MCDFQSLAIEIAATRAKSAAADWEFFPFDQTCVGRFCFPSSDFNRQGKLKLHIA